MLSPIEMFEIEKHKIQATTNCYIVIDRDEYKELDLEETAEYISMPGVLTFVFPDQSGVSHLTFPYKVKLMKSNSVEDDDRTLTINYKSGDSIIDQKYSDSTTDMHNIVSMMHGRTGYIHDPKTLLMLLHEQLSGSDLVHLELIISNIMYTDEDEPCRISGNYKNSITKSQTKVAFDNSWLSAMSYRNIDKAINTGLVKGKDIEENPIEKIINEQYTEA